MAWDALHAKAKGVLPNLEIPAKRYWIGVLHHDKSPEEQLSESDFQWMKAHAKITSEKIRTTYTDKYPGIDVRLTFDGRVLEPTAVVRDLNHYGDNIVIFVAERQPQTPLLSSSHQVESEVHQRHVNPEDSRSALPSFPSPKLTTPVKGLPHTFVKAERQSILPLESPVREPLESFNLQAVFKDSLGVDEEIEARPTDHFIRQLIEKQTPELLEAGVKKAFKVLNSLEGTFAQHAQASADADAWVKAIEKLKSQAERKPTVVGVVGNTGAGKSSVINAMLDEERLVPTNCMRACTAVVTEMSWNSSSDPNCKYRALIEFITPADWEKEVCVLLKEFLTDIGGVSKDTSNPDSDAGIAWAKFHAVYPKITKDMLSSCTVEELMKVKSVLNVLGTTKSINKSRPEPFYRELQRYVDSKEKSTGKKKDSNSSGLEMEFWPLIKVVKIQVKSQALSTGAVIVDLPGVHDSNAARAAVAQGYMKQCTGLWIVAPINRAVDDKAAKTLLGDSFKRQLKYDGGFSSVTFICSKTDDISITEATDSLGLEEQMSTLDDQERSCKKRRKQLNDKIEELKDSKNVHGIAMSDATDEMEIWDALKDQLNDGKTVYAPVRKGNKRKKGRSNKESRKRRHAEDDDDSDDYDSEDDRVSISSDDDSDSDGVAPPQNPLTDTEIKAKLEELRTTRKTARRERSQLDAAMKDVRLELAEIKTTMADIRAEMSAICIAGRNEYFKSAIQLDFAAGIKELDMENAMEEDEENFNPDEELRDYDKVAKSLPVFCVSSRAYQKLCGRLEKDEKVPGFKTPEETEMPQLQAHCKKLTEAGRMQTCRTFLLSFCQLLNTFSLWSSNDGPGLKMTNDEKQIQVQYLQKRLDELEKGLDKAVQLCTAAMKRELCEQIFDKYPEVVAEATRTAPDVARAWGGPKNDGGLLYSTYKALVRRDGVYQSKSAGHRDFNAELSDPITKRLATGWERTFQNRLPKAFELYTKDSSLVLHGFHAKIEERAQHNGVGLAHLSLLKSSITTYEQQFGELNAALIGQMTELQREANRDFKPVITNLMHDVYERCTDERGSGCFMRMKGLMGDHVERARHVMFGAATQTVTGHLNQMCKALEEKMSEKVDEIFLGMKRDYMQVLGGINTDQEAKLPKNERTLQAEIKSMLLTVDGHFKSIASGEIEDTEVGEVRGDDEEKEPLRGTTIIENDDEGATSSETSPTKTSGSGEMRYTVDTSNRDDEEGVSEETEESEGRIQQKLSNEVDDEDDEMGEEL